VYERFIISISAIDYTKFDGKIRLLSTLLGWAVSQRVSFSNEWWLSPVLLSATTDIFTFLYYTVTTGQNDII